MRSLLALLLLLTAPVLPAAAQQRSIAIERFHADIRVLPDARTQITETLDLEFRGSWNGIERDLSLRHVTAEGRRARLALSVTGVTDAAGEALRYEEERSRTNRRLRIWVPGANDAVRTVVIHYEVANALRFFDDATHREGGHDELYWNVTGNEWEMPIRQASASITLPPGADAVEAWAYTGYAESAAQDARVEIAGGQVSVVAERPFAPFEGLTISAVWAPGVVDRSVAAGTSRGERALALWPLLVPALSFLLGFSFWRRNGREPRRRAITAAYEPPAGMSPAEVGTLVDHKAEMHDLTATLVDLAVRGYLVIEEVKKPRLFGLYSTTEYVFHRAKDPQEWGGLAVHERLYLEGLFSQSPASAIPAIVGPLPGVIRRAVEAATAGGAPATFSTLPEDGAERATRSNRSYRDSVTLTQLNQRFYPVLDRIKDAVYGSLVTRGFYRRRPDNAGGWMVAVGMLLAIVGFPLTILSAADELLLDWRLVAGSFAVAAVILILFSTQMKARTEAGVRALESALGFREFLSRVESDRFRRMITSPEQFERYLPFAMAFRVENRWARAFESLYTTPPSWYRGSRAGPFRTTSFTRGLNRMSTRASRTMTARPPSKGGGRSGSGGGGRSGGGSGGGGGRGF